MKQAQRSLFPSLVSRPAPRLLRRVPRPTPALQHRTPPLWLAAHMPDFALEVLLRGQTTSQPQAVIEPQQGTARIHTADARAARAGVTAGMTLATAWALLPGLQVHERDLERERDLLRRLAGWATCFTPRVCIDEHALLLDVRGSLRLFKGSEAIQASVRDGVRRLGFATRIALAPTPRAAFWLARAGREIHLNRPEQLGDVMGELPLAATGFAPDLLEKLRGIGARRVRDLMRLPRDGFARRYGVRALREMDQALGRAPDARRPIVPERRFSARIGLLYEVSEAMRLMQPVGQLLRELDAHLRATQQGASRVRFRLLHREEAFTAVTIGFAEPTRDAARIQDLVEQKLQVLDLSAPVLDIELIADETAALAGRDGALFVEQRNDEDAARLIERLATRLGSDAVHGVEQQEDHRPERAWRFVAPGTAKERAGDARRPHWLLETPQLLAVRNGAPVFEGPLEILDGPERIETGWWDDADVARDYYIARDRHGRRLWVCREVKGARWWLQGMFS